MGEGSTIGESAADREPAVPGRRLSVMRTPNTPRYRLFALLFALALVAFACGGDDDDAVSAGDGGADDGSGTAGDGVDGAEPDGDIFGSAQWKLASGTVDGDDLSLLNTHPITMRVDGGEVAGTAACNSYFGTVVDGATLFEGFGATEMACDPPESMELEFTFLDALGRVTDAAVDGDDLVLTGPDVELRFSTVAPTPDVDLEGGTWLLDTVIDGVSASSILADTAPQVVFENGEMTASDGCNTGSGSYEIDGDTLVLGAVRSTTRGCGEAIMRQAQAFNAVLGSGPTISIEGDRLTLTGPDGLALVFRAG